METPFEGDIFKAAGCDRLGGWWLHLPNLDILIFPPPIFVVGEPFTIEVGKETTMSWKIFESAGLRKGPRWLWISSSNREERIGRLLPCLVVQFLWWWKDLLLPGSCLLVIGCTLEALKGSSKSLVLVFGYVSQLVWGLVPRCVILRPLSLTKVSLNCRSLVILDLALGVVNSI